MSDGELSREGCEFCLGGAPMEFPVADVNVVQVMGL